MEMTQIRLDEEMLKNRAFNCIRMGFRREEILSFFVAEKYSEEFAIAAIDQAFARMTEEPESPFRIVDEKVDEDPTKVNHKVHDALGNKFHLKVRRTQGFYGWDSYWTADVYSEEWRLIFEGTRLFEDPSVAVEEIESEFKEWSSDALTS